MKLTMAPVRARWRSDDVSHTDEGLPTRWHSELILFLFFGMAGITVAATALHTFSMEGLRGAYYQGLMAPAVLQTCDHTFGTPEVLTPALKAFLSGELDHIYCSQVLDRTNQRIVPPLQFHAVHRYLLGAMTLVWKATGIRWASITALSCVLYGLHIAVLFIAFRLALSRPVAILMTTTAMLSSTLINNVPHFRDYAKAPFILGTIALIGVFVRYRPSATAATALATSLGVVLGVGVGVRMDLSTLVPWALLAVLLFSDSKGRLPATVAFLLSFLAISAPIRRAATNGSNAYHVILLGFGQAFTEDATALNLASESYSYSRLYDDLEQAITVGSHAVARGAPAPPLLATREYDVAARSLVSEYVQRFPADMVTRAIAASWNGFLSPWTQPENQLLMTPNDSLLSKIYETRARVVSRLKPARAWLAAVLAVFFLAFDWRRGGFLIAFLVFLCAYPALQFHVRHFFFLDSLAFLAMGLAIEGGVILARSLLGSRQERKQLMSTLVAVISLLGGVGALSSAGLWALRWKQQRQVAEYLAQMEALPFDEREWKAKEPEGGKVRVVVDADRKNDRGNYPAIIVRIAFARGCEIPNAIGTFGPRYIPAAPSQEWQQPVSFRDGRTRHYFPIHLAPGRRFAGVTMDEALSRCLTSVSVLDSPQLVNSLRPLVHWNLRDSEPRLYQFMAEWPL